MQILWNAIVMLFLLPFLGPLVDSLLAALGLVAGE